MRTLDKFFALINENNPFLDVDTSIEVWRKVEEFMGTTRPVEHREFDQVIAATEKLILRAIISYLVTFQPERERNYSTIADLLRAGLEEDETGKTELDTLFDWVKENHEDAFCVNQYFTAKHIDKNFEDATICLLDRLTVLEILEKDKLDQDSMHEDKIIVK